MLTTFPSLLSLSFFVPMLLRITVAVVLAYQAVAHFKNKRAVADEIGHTFKFISHEAAVWLVGLLILGELAVGILLFVGAWTQIAAILATLGFAKLTLFHRIHAYAPLARSTYFLLIIISFTILITGAGAFAFDLPL
jgi:uncharacterized membrane protein YphA (DoxX/SURF4 family)